MNSPSAAVPHRSAATRPRSLFHLSRRRPAAQHLIVRSGKVHSFEGLGGDEAKPPPGRVSRAQRTEAGTANVESTTGGASEPSARVGRTTQRYVPAGNTRETRTE